MKTTKNFKSNFLQFPSVPAKTKYTIITIVLYP